MTKRKPKQAAQASLQLEEKLDVTRARPLAEAFLASRGSAIVVHASAVHHLGAQCAQVLLSARRTWQQEGHAFHIAQPSEAFVDGVRLLGLADHFRD